MVTERELLEAIAECEAEPITPNKIGKLANFYIIYDHLFGAPVAAPHHETIETPIIRTLGDTDFMKAVDGKDTGKVMNILNDLMDSLKVLQPRIYDIVITKISEL